MRRILMPAMLPCLAALCLVANVAQATITHTGTDFDVAVAGVADLQALGYGQTGYYFPQFAASDAVTQKTTWDNMEFNPPSWASFQFDLTQPDRTFSPDAGYFSRGYQ